MKNLFFLSLGLSLLLVACGKSSDLKPKSDVSSEPNREDQLLTRLDCQEVTGNRQLVLIISDPKIDPMAMIAVKSPSNDTVKIMAHKALQANDEELVLTAIKGSTKVVVSLYDLKALADFSVNDQGVDFDCEATENLTKL